MPLVRLESRLVPLIDKALHNPSILSKAGLYFTCTSKLRWSSPIEHAIVCLLTLFMQMKFSIKLHNTIKPGCFIVKIEGSHSITGLV